jgi:hypothetical protein
LIGRFGPFDRPGETVTVNLRGSERSSKMWRTSIPGD